MWIADTRPPSDASVEGSHFGATLVGLDFIKSSVALIAYADMILVTIGIVL